MPDRIEQPIPHPRRLGPTARAIVDMLHEHKITGAQFYKRKHARVEFEFGGRPFVYHFACTPRSDDDSVKQAKKAIAKMIGVW